MNASIEASNDSFDRSQQFTLPLGQHKQRLSAVPTNDRSAATPSRGERLVAQKAVRRSQFLR